jgi:hypothetical protein
MKREALTQFLYRNHAPSPKSMHGNGQWHTSGEARDLERIVLAPGVRVHLKFRAFFVPKPHFWDIVREGFYLRYPELLPTRRAAALFDCR